MLDHISLHIINICKLTGSIFGKYQDYHNFENSTFLQLNRDSSYEFNQQAGLIYFSGKGRWTIQNDTLRLSNNDTSIFEGTSIPQQVFLINGNKLIEVLIDKKIGITLKRSEKY